ncbi:MAG TPA: class I SAM-dependent methyltransferase [Thermoanaerobaculia bacterium]|jgi:SAM-dependent methyltransferase|nr:class I SAM-dependent methyltransferase [Thermoanaerobaculia bacterium]
MIGEAVRRARNVAYRLASPADGLWRRVTGRPILPPLWLRRHTGAVGRFESAATQTAEFLDGLGLVEPGYCVLDIGCGAGAMVAEFTRRIGPAGRYVGFDVHAPSISWCRERYGADPRLTFELAGVSSAYGSRSGPPAASYRFPIDDARADLVLAKSVFTHLLPEDAAHYLSEIRRSLRPGRTAVVTAFLFDPSGPSLEGVRRAFPWDERAGLVRWRLRSRPTAAVAYAKPFFETLLARAGLRLAWMSPGYFPGADRLAGQDTLLVGH